MIEQLKNLGVGASGMTKIGLSMMRRKIESELSREIDRFTLRYSTFEKDLVFRIPDERGYLENYKFPDKDGKLVKAINTVIKKQLEKECEIDFFEIEFTQSGKKVDIHANIYITHDGEKELIPILL